MMGLFKKSTTKKETITTNFNWIHVTSIDELEKIKTESVANPVIIYKHSTRCGISKMVIKQFEKLFTEAHKNFKVYYLDLLNYREVSNEIANIFKVVHQSPQILVIKNGTCVFHTSHEAIADIDLNSFR